MKVFGTIILLIILIMIFSGCDEKPITSDNSLESETNTHIHEEEHFDISKDFLGGKYLEKATTEINIPDKNIFMNGNNAIGYDRVSVLGFNGRLTLITKNQKTVTATFSTDGSSDKVKLREDIQRINKAVSDELGCKLKEFELVCRDKGIDEYEAILSGKGMLKCEYPVKDYEVKLQVLSASGEAVIIVTVSLK